MTTQTKTKKNSGRTWWIIGGVVLIVIMIGAGVFIANRPAAAAAQAASSKQSTVAVTRGNITGMVSGSGTIQPDQTLDLAFRTNGTVQNVLIKKGDFVQVGQPLATLDTRDLDSKVAVAQASLSSAQAQLAQKQKGNGTPADLASAQAGVASAQANLDKVMAGATPAELKAAQAAVSSAQAAYAAAVESSKTTGSDIESLKANLQKAEVAVQQAQAAYDRIGGASNPNIGMLPQSKDLQNATIEYAQAKANYESKNRTSGPDSKSQVASALSTLETAKKNLDALTSTPDQIASAKASLASAQSTLAKLTAPASDSDVAIAQASVASAEQTLKQAQLNLDNATLKAPFVGVITNVDIVPGSNASGAVMTLLDRDPLHVDLKLSENDVVKAALAQTVNLTMDALPGWQTQGKVSYISPSGETSNGVVTYAVTVNFQDADPRVKVGMNLNVDLITAQKDNVLVVPNSALLPQGSGHVVEIRYPDGTTSKVQVQTGISDGSQTEIVSGVNEGEQILALPSTGTTTAPGFGGGRPF